MEEPISLKDYVKKTEVAERLNKRIKEETMYSYIGIGAPIVTYFAIVMGGIWVGIIPIGASAVLYYMRIMKLRQGAEYIKTNYEDKLKKEKKEEFI
jgi:hypothetical protein